MKRSLASDNFSGVHPKVMAALAEANSGHSPAYGNDEYTKRAQQKFREMFGENSATHFVFNGTGAYVLALRALVEPFSAVLCSDLAHIHVDECGAPEAILGCKVITVPNRFGKIVKDDLTKWTSWIGNEHHSQPRVISVSNSTELGTVYTPAELRALANFAHAHGMFLHVDGARIANAIAHLGCSPKDLIVETGVDVLSFGGTKNGMMFGEAVVFPNGNLASRFPFLRKNALQLCSKMRFISAQFLALFEHDLWLQNARAANAIARLLGSELSKIPGIELVAPVEANGVFAHIPPQCVEALQNETFFYMWDSEKSVARFMVSFDVTEADVMDFVVRAKLICS